MLVTKLLNGISKPKEKKKVKLTAETRLLMCARTSGCTTSVEEEPSTNSMVAMRNVFLCQSFMSVLVWFGGGHGSESQSDRVVQGM